MGFTTHLYPKRYEYSKQIDTDNESAVRTRSAMFRFTSLTVLLVMTGGLLPGSINAQVERAVDEFTLELSSEAQDAIDNGVVLTFNSEFAKVKTVLFFDLVRDRKKHQFTVARHTLSNRYVVKRDTLTEPHMFRTIREATNFVVDQSVTLLASYSRANKPRQLRLSLNKYELPAPLRLLAFVSGAWSLDSGWIAWDLET